MPCDTSAKPSSIQGGYKVSKKKSRDKPNQTMDHKTNPIMTKDSFQNSLARLGFNMPSLLNATEYPNTRLTQNYNLMNSLYRSNWIVRKIVDVIPEDMCKNWIKINTQIDPSGIKQFEKTIRRTKTKEKVLDGLKWGRLYGGAAGIILIEGQEDMLDKPLDYNLIMPGSYKGLLILDRWSGISPSTSIVDDLNSPDFGMPEYYQITTQSTRTYNVHHSRVIRFVGNKLPQWESWAEQQWGASVVESIYDELTKRDNTSFNIANLVFLANLRIYKSNMLGDMLGLGDPQIQQDFYNTMQYMNMMMNNNGMTIIGKEDEFDTKQYTFSGINDIYESFMLDVAGACEIPVTRLFGRSPAGFNATGESDLTNYYDSIEEKQEAYLRPVLEKLLPIIALSTWGMIPEDLDYDYNPLRKADPKENADLSKAITESIVNVYNASLISQKTALKELRQQNEVTGMWSNITDDDIEQADANIDLGGEFGGLESLLPNFNQPQKMIAFDADWKEEDHPRAENGQFGSCSGEAETKTNSLTNKEESGNLKSSPKGKNTFKQGFSQSNLDRHWTGGESDHSDQYPEMSKEEYAQRALELVQMPVGNGIDGYVNAGGQVVRYDLETNDFVKGHPDRGIATMFKPKRKEEYFKDRHLEEGVDEDD